MSRIVVARAPTRIDFGGGWTDVPPYPEERGGFVCNVAISRYATARVEPGDAGLPDADAERHGTSALVAAAVRAAGVAGVRVSLASDFPIGAGLGGSSAAGVAVHGALARWRGEALEGAALAERSRAAEVDELGIPGGRQDHYAAALGGALALTFGHGVAARALPLPAATVDALERRCVLVYTGRSRISGDTITAVLDAYRDGERRVLDALARMKALAMAMADALDGGDVDALGALVGEHWVHQRALHPAITTPRIDEIIARATAAGAIGCKALGASGGGCVLAIAPAGGEDAVRDAVAAHGAPLSFGIARRGFEVLHDGAAADAPSLSSPVAVGARTTEGAR